MRVKNVAGGENPATPVTDEPMGKAFGAGSVSIGGVAVALRGNKVLEELVGADGRCVCW